MRLYVANCTIQMKQLMYRLDFDTSGERDPRSRFMLPKQQPIASGRQMPVGGHDLHETQVREIEDQLRLYGAVDVSETKNLHISADFVMSRDKPVPAVVIERVGRNNLLIQTEEGRVRRMKAAVAANDVLDTHIGEPAPMFEVEYEQETESGTPNEKMLGEGVKVVRTPPVPGKPPRQREARARKAA